MNLVLFLAMIIISFVIVRIGAIAFELTGLEWSLAKFQALSCFSGTGFTTREAELITGHPQRRRIASILMVFGNAGLVTLVATFANTIRPRVNITGLPSILNLPIRPALMPWINLLFIVLAGYVIYRIFSRATTLHRLTEYLRGKVKKSDLVQPVSFEQLMVATAGYGVASVTATEKNAVVGKMLKKSGLREKDITVLAFERQGKMIPNPPADTRIATGDRLVCFGKMDVIRQEFAAEMSGSQSGKLQD